MYGRDYCKHLVSWCEGYYCTKIEHLFADFEGYEDYCNTCDYYEKKEVNYEY